MLPFIRRPLLLAMALSYGCRANLDIPPDAKITCDTTSECPGDYVCLVSIRTCVRKDGDITLPYVVDSSVVPTQATRGSVVTVTLEANGVLAAPPSVTLTWNGSSPGSAGAVFVANDGASYVFAYTVGDAEPEGPLALHADLVSVAGVPNAYDQPNVLQLDFHAPVLVPDTNVVQLSAPPGSLRTDVSAATIGTTITALFGVNESLAPGAVVLNRTPHASAGAPRLTLVAAAGALEPGVGVFAWDAPDPSTAILIARTTAAADGSLASFVLPGVDRKNVYAQAVDAAGNASAPVRILDATWTATIGGKTAGNTFDNPNRLVEAPLFLRARDAQLSEPQSPTLLAAADGALLTTYGGPAWSIGPNRDDHPSARGGCRMAQDDIHGNQVLFGGWWGVYGSGNATSDETWAFDGYNWSRYPLGVRPPARAGHALVFDKARGVTVLFGGCADASQSCGTRFGDTWTFDGVSWTRACWPGCGASQCGCDAMPSPRENPQMFWDDKLGQVVLFGGSDGSARNDMWTWDGETWAELHPAHLPGARSNALLATNSAENVTIMVGGSGASDTWFWRDGDWTLGTTSPRPAGQQLWYDEVTQRFTVVATNGGLVSTWTGSAWTTAGGALSEASGTLSSSTNEPCGGFDSDHGTFVWFGGCPNSSCRIDGQALDGTFLLRAPSTGSVNATRLATPPAARAYAAMAPIGAVKKVAFAGGTNVIEPNSNSFGGYWIWDSTWALMTAYDSRQSGCCGHNGLSMAAVSNSVVVRIGGLGSTVGGPPETRYTLNGATWGAGGGTDYTEPTSDDGSGHIALQQMTYKPGTGGILYRGSPTRTTWVATSSGSNVTWTAQSPSTVPTSKERHGFAYCANAGGSDMPGGAVLFGGKNGATYLDETWVWYNGNWRLRSPPRKPAARAEAAMFCDSGRGNVYLFGGTNGARRFDDVWEWDGETWHDRTPQRRPSARASAAVAHMQWVDRGILFGGYDSGVYGDTWIWDGGASSAPAHSFFAQYAEADVWSSSTVLRVDTTWVSGGTGYTAGGAQDGAAIYIWDGGRWRATGATNDATADAPAPVTWSTGTDPEWSSYDDATRTQRLRRLFTGIEHGISFAVTPRGQNRASPSPAVVASDYAEVKVTYRLSP